MATYRKSNHPNAGGKVILLCGAGASSYLGLPTLDDLLKRAILGNDDVADRIRRTQDAISTMPDQFRSAVFEELIVKIREYITAAQMIRIDHTFRKEFGVISPKVDNGELERNWKQALTRCYRVLLDEYGPNKIDVERKEFKTTLDLYESLSELNGGRLHIYTTNYDCSYQVLASSTDRMAFYSHINNLDGRFTEKWFKPGDFNSAKSNNSCIYIHRLHGCVGWFQIEATYIREIYGVGGGLTIDNDDFLHKMCIKLIASQLVGTNLVFSSAFEEFYNHLKKAVILLVWGYSFRDLEVLRAINDAFYIRKIPLKVMYIDPFLSECSVQDHIQGTMSKALIQLSSKFKPTQIDWKPTDGHLELKNKVVESIIKEITK